jgi:hypothetical protein
MAREAPPRTQSAAKLDSAREHLSAVFDILAGAEDRWIRQMIPLAIGMLYRGSGIGQCESLSRFCADPIDSARRYAAFSHGAVADGGADLKRIAALASSHGDEHLRAGFLEAMALATTSAPDPGLMDVLKHAVSDPSPFVKEAAYRAAGYLARTLGTRREKPWMEILERGIWDETLGCASAGERTEVRRGAIEGMGIAFQGSADRAALEGLARYVQDWSNYHLVAESAFSIGMAALGTRDAYAMSLLRRSLQHPEAHVRWNTGLGMGLVYFRSGDVGLLDDCEVALCDDDDAVRYYSSLGVSLAFSGQADKITPYYRLWPERLEEYSRRDLSLPNIDAILIAPADRRFSYGGLGVHLQSYSSWYSLPFYCTSFQQDSAKLSTGRKRVQIELDCEDLLTLTVAHRFGLLRERAGVSIYRTVADAYRSLKGPRNATGGLAVRYAKFWDLLDSFTRVHARSHVAELVGKMESFSAALENLPNLKSMAPTASALMQPVVAVAAGADDEELARSFRTARAVAGSLAFLGYRVALADVLLIWESAVANA